MALCGKGGRDGRSYVGRGRVGGVVDVGEVALDLGAARLYFPPPTLVPSLDELREQKRFETGRHVFLHCFYPDARGAVGGRSCVDLDRDE